MSKTSRKKSTKADSTAIPDIEDLDSLLFASEDKQESLKEIRNSLLTWYDSKKRVLPWRKPVPSDSEKRNQRAYEVWVSEVMLQQTKVETVIEYYKKWFETFPTLEDLAKADLEDVNSAWSGLGYYRRAKFLHEGAKKVVNTLKGVIPSTVEGLLDLPGVGRYTAGAIASIAFEKVAPIVDGNVSRVVSRLRTVPHDITNTKVVNKVIWPLSQQLVDTTDPALYSEADDKSFHRPGDFNQALMELGATVCTPKNPKCKECPVSKFCKAFKEGEPEKYPVKKAKQQPAPQTLVSCVFVYPGKEEKFLMVKRPEKGLLAGLWEFPAFIIPDDTEKDDHVDILKKQCLETENIKEKLSPFLSKGEADEESDEATEDFGEHEFSYCGEIEHVFSHIRQTIHLYKVKLGEKVAIDESQSTKASWVTEAKFKELGVPTVQKKLMKLFATGTSKKAKTKKPKEDEEKPKKRGKTLEKRKREEPAKETKAKKMKQSTLTAFIK